MPTPLLPALANDDIPAWQSSLLAFLAEKERRSGSRRTVEGYARMLWPFLLRIGSPELVAPAHVLAWAHGIGLSGREPSSATVGARIACLSSYFRFLIRMRAVKANPGDTRSNSEAALPSVMEFECQIGELVGARGVAATLSNTSSGSTRGARPH